VYYAFLMALMDNASKFVHAVQHGVDVRAVPEAFDGVLEVFSLDQLSHQIQRHATVIEAFRVVFDAFRVVFDEGREPEAVESFVYADLPMKSSPCPTISEPIPTQRLHEHAQSSVYF
jgi:hypothetical protein